MTLLPIAIMLLLIFLTRIYTLDRQTYEGIVAKLKGSSATS